MNNERDTNYPNTHKIINERRYHNEENLLYYLPDDDKETDRIYLEHNILRYIWQGNFSSRIEERLIKENTKVIDLGCGSGQWSIDMSLKYPLSTFIGIDISSISFPPQENKPDNLAFLQHNLLEHPGVPFPNEIFDFVFLRNLAFKMEYNGWGHVINEAVRVTNINGCIEIMNYDLYKDNEEVSNGPIMNKFQLSLNMLHDRDNMKMPTSTDVIEYLYRTNRITNIQVEEKISPLGPWGGKLGELALVNFKMAYNGFKVFLQPYMKITEDEYDNLLNELGNECNKYKTRFYTYRVYGTKC
ncbi:S-adenosyl-L-methionine-dependent methyltransferase [Glomus cerebriforme]|uniref:S-adenosyl-L-methionine-dependent methyltransferase n=1 Tax=Glomus cerebriforme TaxID=658196 RepID=A0A397TL90_9GLOM|nr:S-adenosyl-L-methionine-dependent methyltransferase [Glomus cerebriforme]